VKSITKALKKIHCVCLKLAAAPLYSLFTPYLHKLLLIRLGIESHTPSK
jgi:hypothetical protein